MKQEKWKRKILGITYLFFAGSFGAMLFITFSYMPRNIEVDIIFIKNNLLNFVWLYMIFNFVLSFFIGMTLLLYKQNMNRWLVKIILIMGGTLVFFDLPPIVNGIWALITKGTVNIPWTIIIFGFHVYLFFSLFTFTRDKGQKGTKGVKP